MEKKLPIDAIIMAGGKGTRLFPLTLETPKPLLEINDKPIIEIIIRRLKASGISTIYISVNHKKKLIKDFLERTPGLYKNMIVVEEGKPLGTIGSLKIVNSFESNYLLVINADVLTDMHFGDFFLKQQQTGADIVVAGAVNNFSACEYDLLQTNGERVTGFGEGKYVNAGIYLLKKKVIALIETDRIFHATDLIKKALKKQKKIILFPITGYWNDIGTPKNFFKANEDIKQLKL